MAAIVFFIGRCLPAGAAHQAIRWSRSARASCSPARVVGLRAVRRRAVHAARCSALLPIDRRFTLWPLGIFVLAARARHRAPGAAERPHRRAPRACSTPARSACSPSLALAAHRRAAVRGGGAAVPAALPLAALRRAAEPPALPAARALSGAAARRSAASWRPARRSTAVLDALAQAPRRLCDARGSVAFLLRRRRRPRRARAQHRPRASSTGAGPLGDELARAAAAHDAQGDPARPASPSSRSTPTSGDECYAGFDRLRRRAAAADGARAARHRRARRRRARRAATSTRRRRSTRSPPSRSRPCRRSCASRPPSGCARASASSPT